MILLLWCFSLQWWKRYFQE